MKKRLTKDQKLRLALEAVRNAKAILDCVAVGAVDSWEPEMTTKYLNKFDQLCRRLDIK
jgi:hypothetical protein